MMYEAILNIGLNEFGPVNKYDTLFLIGTMLCSAILNAIIFGDIASLLIIIAKRNMKY